jgi:hypothetical protein
MRLWVLFIKANTPPPPGAPPHSRATILLVGIVQLFSNIFLGILGSAFLSAILYAVTNNRKAFDSNGVVAISIFLGPILFGLGVGVFRFIKSVSQR